MHNDPNQNDPFDDGFDERSMEDPFIDDHFGTQEQAAPNRVEQLPDSTAILVLGILSILGAFCYGIVGLVMGIVAVAMASKPERLYRMDPGRYTASSHSNLRAGKICGIIGICISVLMILILIVVIIAAVNDSPGYYRF